MHNSRLVELLHSAWWVLALRGGVAIAFGVLALAMPRSTLVALVLLFAAYALIAGSASIAGAVRHRRTPGDKGWRLMLLVGVYGFAAGVFTLLIPGLTALLFVLVMAANAIAVGVLDIMLAIRLRKRIHREWLLALAGAVSVAFGVLVFLVPAAGVLALVLLISFYGVTSGALLLALALRVRRWRQAAGALPARPAT